MSPAPYDTTEMLLAFHVSEKARTMREQHLLKFPEHLRETEKRKYPRTRCERSPLGSGGGGFTDKGVGELAKHYTIGRGQYNQ